LSPADPPYASRPREPLINAPLIPLVMALLLVGLFLVQTGRAIETFALIPARIDAGAHGGLLTHLFLHGGWAHVILNALGLLAFGAPVARLLGGGVRGGLLFLAFYLLCGLLAGLGFVLLHPAGEQPVVGASGAVAGLMAAASRLIERPGRLSGFQSRPVVGMAAGWLAINGLAAIFGTLPGAGGAAIAWEAHLAGYSAGLVLIGPVARLAGRR
jgi:membrane associated rhomboid family serine protease